VSIKTIKHESLKIVWECDDLSVLPSLYAYEVRDVLFDLDAAQKVSDLEDIGAIQYNPDEEDAWSVTITVNRVEPCGAITCDFWAGDCYNVNLREYNP